ncbi:MAG: polysaccharide pyruvyl transferase family protein, partial [Nitrososphaera sp.]|nr:polysaccharide pyruvyl transferase family protein [Nitrososphaera sp.]
ARDKERLTDYGVAPERITAAADLAWILEAASVDFGKGCLTGWGIDANSPLVGVNVNNERFVQAQDPRLSEKLGMFLDELVDKHGASILFFCNEVREDESFDKAAGLKVLACMTRGEKGFLVPNNYWTPQQMLSLIGCCHVTIGIRYHFCLFSALQNVPFIALKRSDKVDDLCWDIDWSYGLSLKGLDVSVLVDMFVEIAQKRLSVCKHLQQKTELMREKALRNRIALDALTRQEAQ